MNLYNTQEKQGTSYVAFIYIVSYITLFIQYRKNMNTLIVFSIW